MRIGSGVQSVSELFGKQQNNSKTYVAENGKEFEEKININDIDLRNASYVEMSALEAYYDVDRGNGLSSFPEETGHMGLNERCDLISSFEKVIRDMNKLGRYDLQMFYMRNMNTYLNANSKHKQCLVI